MLPAAVVCPEEGTLQQGQLVAQAGERELPENGKGCDFGYALAGNSCEGVSGVDACTVAASEVIAAFAVPNLGGDLAIPSIFSGLAVPSSRLAAPITWPTSSGILFRRRPFRPSTWASTSVVL